mgnify:CR=1 FL=1
MQIIESPRVYPVIVIGSGASGGMAAWNLTQQGVDVLMLHAGDKLADRSQFWTHVTPWEARERRAHRADAGAVILPHPATRRGAERSASRLFSGKTARALVTGGREW